jgi:hypothetical protein
MDFILARPSPHRSPGALARTVVGSRLREARRFSKPVVVRPPDLRSVPASAREEPPVQERS